ncbi:MAG: hypothetical protein H6883_13995 [Rhodobiaceae bacterium]|nr:hypothetical protein [Rhodobiaceae bacterium]MCC0057230.1 hypothetical protein [Rhodobiaceae bacterium]
MQSRRYQSGPDDPIVRAFSYPYEQAEFDGALDPESGVLNGLADLSVQPAPDTCIAGFDALMPCCRLTAEGGAPDERRHLLLASGSNASPSQLIRKFHGRQETQPIILLQTPVRDLVAVHSAHITAYGAVAGTLMAWAGAVSRLTVLAVTTGQLQRINETESLGKNYDLAVLPAGTIAQMPGCGILIYRSRRGVFAPFGAPLRLEAFAASGSLPPAVSQRQALDEAASAANYRDGREAFVMKLVSDSTFREAATRAMRGLAISDGLQIARTIAVRA